MTLRRKKRPRRLHLAFWTTGFWLIASGVIQAEPLNVQGSTTFTSRLLLPYQSEIEAAAGHKLVAFPNKSSTGLIALFEGRADLAMISSSLDSEVAVLKKTRSDLPFDRLRSFEVSRVRAAFAVHPDNPVRKTSNDTMRRVLLGELTNWRELGGLDLPIRLVAVRAGGGGGGEYTAATSGWNADSCEGCDPGADRNTGGKSHCPGARFPWSRPGWEFETTEFTRDRAGRACISGS